MAIKLDMILIRRELKGIPWLFFYLFRLNEIKMGIQIENEMRGVLLNA